MISRSTVWWSAEAFGDYEEIHVSDGLVIALIALRLDS